MSGQRAEEERRKTKELRSKTISIAVIASCNVSFFSADSFLSRNDPSSSGAAPVPQCHWRLDPISPNSRAPRALNTRASTSTPQLRRRSISRFQCGAKASRDRLHGERPIDSDSRSRLLRPYRKESFRCGVRKDHRIRDDTCCARRATMSPCTTGAGSRNAVLVEQNDGSALGV